MKKNDERFTVTWLGMDGLDHEDEFTSLSEAQHHAVCISELGAHCITVSDSNGDDYGF